VAGRGALLVVGASLLFSSGGLFIKLAPLPGLAVACGRAIVTTLFFLVALRPPLRQARWSTAVAYAGMVITFVVATKTTTAANAVFLQYTAPAFVLVLAPWLLRERFRPVDGLCVLLSLAGMSLVLMGDAQPGQRAGDVIGVISGVLFAFTIVFLRRDAATAGPGVVMASTTLGNLLAAAVTLPLAAPDLPAALAPGALVVLLYLGVVQVGLAYVLLNRGLRTVPAARASLLSMIEPVMNPVWVLLGTGERPSLPALLGGVVVLGVVALRSRLRDL
jgi:drug/metabolite transporter (DMT)-like permease